MNSEWDKDLGRRQIPGHIAQVNPYLVVPHLPNENLFFVPESMPIWVQVLAI